MTHGDFSTAEAVDITLAAVPGVSQRTEQESSNFVSWWRAHPAVRGLAYFFLALAIMASFVIVYVWSPWWIDGHRLRMLALNYETTALATDRDEVLKIMAGFAGLVAVFYTVRRHNIDRRTLEATQGSVILTQKRDTETVRLTTEAQVTDRYIKAIGLLASKEPDERLGGIYALERLMVDSPRDQSTIVEVLAASIRRASPWPLTVQPSGTPPPALSAAPATDTQRPSTDLVAAITVLARRPREENPRVIDLRRTNLAGLELGHPVIKSSRSQGNLSSVDLRNANLTGANLSEIDLTEALLIGADMTRARFRFTILAGADLSESILADAYLGRVNAQRARLRKARLVGADLFRSGLVSADFTEAGIRQSREQYLAW